MVVKKTTPKRKAEPKKNKHVKKLKINPDVEALMEPITKEEFEDALKKVSRKIPAERE